MTNSAIHKSHVDELDDIRTAMRTDKWANEHPGWLTNRDGVAWKGDKMVRSSAVEKVLRETNQASTQMDNIVFL
ncbi:hypothetical protein NXF25_000151 [Crotalus adamanteus]|uniref:Uncharacterized protein n=1 Tax=Crotalus adamanteus TaxID=8729 RepID=A0AAW1C346_CROAD